MRKDKRSRGGAVLCLAKNTGKRAVQREGKKVLNYASDLKISVPRDQSSKSSFTSITKDTLRPEWRGSHWGAEG